MAEPTPSRALQFQDTHSDDLAAQELERLVLRSEAQGSAREDESPPPMDSASFADLPREIRLQVLGACDWKTLYRAAATCRSNHALVRGGTGGVWWRE